MRQSMDIIADIATCMHTLGKDVLAIAELPNESDEEF